MSTPSEWTPHRLHDRFEEVDRRLAALERDVRVVLPVAGQVAHAEAAAIAVERELEDVRAELRAVERAAADEVRRAVDAARLAADNANATANDVIRSGRTENLKLIGIVVGSFTTLAGSIITLVATGKIG